MNSLPPSPGSPPLSAVSQSFAGVAFTCAALALILLIALHVLRSELDPSWRMISEYANGPHGWMMALCFLCLSAGCACLLVALVPHLTSVAGRAGLGFLILASLGLALAAVFPSDPITITPAEASQAGKMHGLSALLGIPSFVIAAGLISISLLGMPLWQPMRWPVLVFAHLNWISLVLLACIALILLPRHGGFGPAVPVGWPNRSLVLAWIGWLMASAWPLMTGKASPGP